MLSDPVCGKRMQRVKAHAIVEYQGIAYSLLPTLSSRI